MKKYLLALVAGVAGFAAVLPAARAQDGWQQGLYISGSAGWNHTQDQKITGASKSNLKEGYGLSGAVGYDYGNNVRTEIELSYRSNKVDGLSDNTGPFASPGGKVTATAVMANAYYDIPTATPVTPYIGAGIGIAHVKTDNYSTAGTIISDGKDNAFAYQGILGADYALESDLSLFGEYRYFSTEKVNMGYGNKGTYHNHALMAGLKYSFN
ncbi:MAG: porin family protein [Rhodospirillales bacterium]|nr:porin family protein [Alphaproteobacteria bacterium]MCB9986787.1 porin family protein [Rhodospirillales bacterium]USO08445.1 MAG: porin family protein [Rhodospirillales bacterium]